MVEAATEQLQGVKLGWFVRSLPPLIGGNNEKWPLTALPNAHTPMETFKENTSSHWWKTSTHTKSILTRYRRSYITKPKTKTNQSTKNTRKFPVKGLKPPTNQHKILTERAAALLGLPDCLQAIFLGWSDKPGKDFFFGMGIVDCYIIQKKSLSRGFKRVLRLEESKASLSLGLQKPPIGKCFGTWHVLVLRKTVVYLIVLIMLLFAAFGGVVLCCLQWWLSVVSVRLPIVA